MALCQLPPKRRNRLNVQVLQTSQFQNPQNPQAKYRLKIKENRPLFMNDYEKRSSLFIDNHKKQLKKVHRT